MRVEFADDGAKLLRTIELLERHLACCALDALHRRGQHRGQEIGPAEWLDYVLELLALLDGCIVDGRGQPAYLSTEIFLPTDQEIDDGVGAVIEYRMRNWFEETFATPVPESVTPHVRIEAKERFRIVATILRARFPAQAAMWGVRAANDNFAPIPPTEQTASA